MNRLILNCEYEMDDYIMWELVLDSVINLS